MRMELAPIPGESMSLSDIDGCLGELDSEFRELFAASKEDGGYLKHADTFKRITEDMAALKEKKALMLAQQEENSVANRRIQDAVSIECRFRRDHGMEGEHDPPAGRHSEGAVCGQDQGLPAGRHGNRTDT